jgi:hypothetical protein
MDITTISDTSDSDDFINVEDLMSNSVENIYQIQIYNQKLVLSIN